MADDLNEFGEDEHEQQFHAMYADLAAAGQLPPSIVMMEEAARRQILSGALTRDRFIADRIFAARATDA